MRPTEIDRAGLGSEEGTMPADGTVLANEQIALIRAWIEQGASP